MSTPHPYAEILRAIADGKVIQFRADPGEQWETPAFQEPVMVWIYAGVYRPDQLRVKPEPRICLYRVAEMRSQFDGRTYTYTADIDGDELQRSTNFVRWLTDWIEYEVSE